MSERGQEIEAGELHGGEVWGQPRFPCFSYYVVFLGDDRWCLIAPPDHGHGCIATTNPKGPNAPIYTKAELLAHFDYYGFVCRGQFVDIRNAEYEAMRGA